MMDSMKIQNEEWPQKGAKGAKNGEMQFLLFVPFGAPAPPTQTNEMKRVHHAN